MTVLGQGHRDGMDRRQAGVPGLAQVAVAQGWRPLTGQPFDDQLAGAIHDLSRVLLGVPPTVTGHDGVRVGGTEYGDAFRGSISGRTIIVANAWTSVAPAPAAPLPGTAVCAVELSSVLPVACVQPRRFPALTRLPERPTGNPAFDLRYAVAVLPGADPEPLTWDVQQRIMAREDWVFRAERYVLACVSAGAFAAVEEVSQRIGEVLAIAEAIGAAVTPVTVEDSDDELLARAGRLTSLEDAIAFLASLSPAERDRLACSPAPVAALADVTTAQEAVSRFQALDQQRKMELIAIFQANS
ncbi:MAG: hypothetical protein ACRDRJ_29695 [Streptosporangiaceae bacterium]